MCVLISVKPIPLNYCRAEFVCLSQPALQPWVFN